MKLRFIVLILFLLVTLLGAFPLFPNSRSNAVPTHVDVVLTENGFTPNDITISRGGTITFSTTLDRHFWPASNLHPSHGIYREFDPFHPIAPNERWTFTFGKTGEWNFHDHLRSFFIGTIHVVE